MQKIDIIEVGPRDGFQNIDGYIPLEVKIEVIKGLVTSGVKHIEHTSFVSPKAIPQLKDARELTEIVTNKHPETDFFPLIPNLRGAQDAWDLGLEKAAYVVSLSKSHNEANINRTHEESLNELKNIINDYPKMDIVLDLSTAFGCPFEGKFSADQVVAFLADYVNLGIRTICLCDTIGIGTPKEVREIVKACQNAYPDVEWQVHIHDTRNMGMVNTLVAIEEGITKVQSTLGGLGGCPFAPGASGNLATEDLVYMLNEMGYDTGIDFEALLDIAKWQRTKVEGLYSGHHINIGN